MKWISTNEKWPKDETIVLIVYKGDIKLGGVFMDYPSHEEIYESFQYWDSPDGGAGWECWEVTHWMPLPEVPEIEREPEP